MTTAAATAPLLRQLAELAGAAEIHAREQYSIALRPGDWAPLDQILDRERTGGHLQDRESLALCYGAWVGQALVSTQNAVWVALQEPVPPRVRIQQRDYSPIDAVRRRLFDSAAMTLAELVREATATESIAAADIRKINRAAWDRCAQNPRFVNPAAGLPLTPAEIHAALDPWLANLELTDRKVLCLAAAGGTHGPLLARAGAHVTVADFSPALLEIDARVARQQNLDLTVVEADLCDLSPLADRTFDIVVQPVSACYIPDLWPMYAEIARVLKPGGLYLSQQKSPASLQAGAWEPAAHAYRVPYPVVSVQGLPPTDNPALSQREQNLIEWVHPLNALLGDLCRSGFVIEDFQEPVRADHWAAPESAAHRAAYFPPYLKILARRRN